MTFSHWMAGVFEDDSDQTLAIRDLQDLASHRIVRRGLDYARAGRVLEVESGPNTLKALVQGSNSRPYRVALQVTGQELQSRCTCPFDWEPFCKHAIAALAVHFDIAGYGLDDGGLDSELEQAERDVRRQRGQKSPFTIRKRWGGDFLGSYSVKSPSESSYNVEIRSLGERVNRCSCPDYMVSMLGTCKHIEAVLHFLRRRAPRKFETAAQEKPNVGQVLADYSDTPRIRLLMPANPTPALKKLAREYFDEMGYFAKDPVGDFQAFLQRARRLRKLVIYDDALGLSSALEQERQGQERKKSVHQEVLRGGLRPGSLRTDLYPFQLTGTAFLASAGRGLLGDEMGLGKTIQAIGAARVLAERGEVGRVLVVCPASLKTQWKDEIQKFTGLDAQIVGGNPPNRLAQYRRGASFTIANYELVLRDSRAIFDLAPDLLILDEAQRIRNWRTKTATAIKAIKTRFAFVLTGTALQNRLDDLYSIMQVVEPRLMGPLWAFNEAFVVRSETGRKILGYRNLDELRRRLSPRVLRRELSEVRLQLPERIDSRLAVSMTMSQRELMEEGVQNAAILAKIAEKRPLTLQEHKRMMSAMQMARMACNAAGLVDKETEGSPKLAEFEDLIVDICLGEDRKVVVFSEWVRFCDMAAACAKRQGINFVRLDGGVPSAKRGGLIEKFRDDPDCKIFFSTDAGGVGLNLQFASAVINLDMPWNPAVLDQRIGRVHRQGQNHPVHVFVLVAEDSFENSLERTISAKRGIFSAALDQRSEAVEVDAPSSCLHVVKVVLEDLESSEKGLPDGEVLEEVPAFKPENGREPVSESEPKRNRRGAKEEADPGERTNALAGILGTRLHQVVILSTGQMVALVDKLDDMVLEVAGQQGMVAMENAVADAMSSLGEANPFTNAKVIFDSALSSPQEGALQRRKHLGLARRKLRAAQTLASADLGAEAAAQAFHAMLSAAIGAAYAAQDGLEIDEDMPTARLLYEVLVSRGVLSLEQAGIISRAEGLARTYAESTDPIPVDTLHRILVDAKSLVRWADQS